MNTNTITALPVEIASAIERARLLNAVEINGWEDAAYDALDMLVEAADFGDIVLTDEVAELDARRYEAMSDLEAANYTEKLVLTLTKLI